MLQMTTTMRSFITILLVCCILYAPSSIYAFSSSFSLSDYQKARAKETSNQLDASRFHFQILFVDNDNFHGRIAEGMLAQIAEYNDALFTLFPYSSTVDSSSFEGTTTTTAIPMDPTVPQEALVVCEALGLCSITCAEDGTAFDVSYCLDQYDLIIAVNEDIQSRLLFSLPPDSGYEHKCRRLSEFLSLDFCGIQNPTTVTDQSLQDMMNPSLWERVQPFYDLVRNHPTASDILSGTDSTTLRDSVIQPRMVLGDNGAAIPNPQGWPLREAAMLMACTGITRFCLDTMDAQFETAFQALLQTHFYRREHLEDFTSISQADDQLRKGSLTVTGYFSPQQRQTRIENHFEELRSKFL